jgi:hypothetical protein
MLKLPTAQILEQHGTGIEAGPTKWFKRKMKALVESVVDQISRV